MTMFTSAAEVMPTLTSFWMTVFSLGAEAATWKRAGEQLPHPEHALFVGVRRFDAADLGRRRSGDLHARQRVARLVEDVPDDGAVASTLGQRRHWGERQQRNRQCEEWSP